jgi:hypothetical protein
MGLVDPEQVAKNDQAMSVIVEYCVPNLRSFFNASVKEGFTSEEALELTKELMKMMLVEEKDKDKDNDFD